MAYTDAGTGWGLTPGAASENLSRMAGGGYGSMYGDNNNSPIYEQRMAQIRGNFASRQAQLGEERRRTENDRANTLAQQKYGTQKDQYEKDYLMKQEQYDQSQQNWEKNWEFNQQKYEDDQKAEKREMMLKLYGSAGGAKFGSDAEKRAYYDALGIPYPESPTSPWDDYNRRMQEYRRNKSGWNPQNGPFPGSTPNPPGYTPPEKIVTPNR